jgi:hypothetical protein
MNISMTNNLFSSVNLHNKKNVHLDDKINSITQKIEEMSLNFNTHEEKNIYFKEKHRRMQSMQEVSKTVDKKENFDLNFNQNVIHKLLKNSEKENRNMIDAMLNGRIASIDLASCFRAKINKNKVGDNTQTQINLPFSLNLESFKLYKKKENNLVKELLNFKESEIYKYI